MDFDEKNSKLEIVWQNPNHRTNTEAEQNQTTEQMLPNQHDYYPNEWGAMNNPIAMAGVNQVQAQNLNFLFIKNQLEIMRRQDELNMQFQYQRNLQMLKNTNRLPPEETVPIMSPKIVITPSTINPNMFFKNFVYA